MEEELVNPNWHVALVHFPVALLILGTFIELFSFLYRKSSFRTAGRWMILLGVLSSVPVALTGLYALGDATAMNNPAAGDIWREVQNASPLQGPARGTIERHAWVMGFTTVLGLVTVLTWLASSDRWRARLYKLCMLLLLTTVGLTMYGAWISGESVYMLRTAVVPEGVKPEKKPGIHFYVPPMQAHVLLAGTAFALSLVSFAVTMRRVNGIVDTQPPAPVERTDPMAVLRSLSPDSVFSRVDVPSAGRFWLMAFGVAVLASLVGWYMLADGADAWRMAKESKQSIFKQLWVQIKPERDEQVNRRFAHVIGGGTIIVLPLVLAMIARWGPKRRGLVIVMSFVLFAVIAAQIWIGTLLMWDTPGGSILRFNTITPPPPTRTTAATTRPVEPPKDVDVLVTPSTTTTKPIVPQTMAPSTAPTTR